MRMRWTTQNEATSEDGFLLEGEASFVAEMALLKSVGCPDASDARLASVEVARQTESVMTAEVSVSMARWLEEETDAEDES
jgi:hypothetical protein